MFFFNHFQNKDIVLFVQCCRRYLLNRSRNSISILKVFAMFTGKASKKFEQTLYNWASSRSNSFFSMELSSTTARRCLTISIRTSSERTASRYENEENCPCNREMWSNVLREVHYCIDGWKDLFWKCSISLLLEIHSHCEFSPSS